MRARAVAAVVALLVAPLALAGCGGGGDEDAAGPSASSSPVKQLTPITLPPPPPPTGTLLADIEQSSRDAAAGRFQVWVGNDTDATIHPTEVIYTDGRFRAPLAGTRLREIPSQARRGFQFPRPGRPACGSTATAGEVTVTYTSGGEQHTMTVPVADEADVIARVATSTCLERGIARVADLSFADEVPANGAGGKGSTATLTLIVRPTGTPGPTLTIDSIAGNPVLSPADPGGVWHPGLTITGDQAPQRVALELKPTRCDAHAFGESGSLASFAFNVHLDGRPGQVVIALSVAGEANAIDFAKNSCGELTGL